MYLHAHLKSLPMRVFQVSSLNFRSMCVKVGSTKALNNSDWSSQHVPTITAHFLKVPIKAFIPTILPFTRWLKVTI